MGGYSSAPEKFAFLKSTNDFELVIRASKELEYILEQDFKAQGKGLHEKISSVSGQFSVGLTKRMRFLATIRNKLTHEYGFNEIPDREAFIRNFEDSVKELALIVEQIRLKNNPGQNQSSCAIC